ncbi:FkbM family methyltransferase [Thermogladius sp. 4427co]|uniref:FkbM family methyltransferase n=1 Tax=Thermogladius sp. 4427co TaxID=3450718 RepID=UPI003F7A3E66
MVKLHFGVKIYVNNLDTIFINIPDMFERREYMLHPDFIPRKGNVVIDVGAYIGVYSLVASKLVDDGFVIAFEPNPESFYWLVNNIRLNKVKNIKALPYALGNSIGFARLYMPKANIEASSLIKDHLLKNPVGDLGVLKYFDVPLVTLDYILSNSSRFIGRKIDSVDIAKIDVEGYELKVLEGSKNILSRGVIDKLVIEVHIDQVKTTDLLSFLRDYGYRLARIKHFDHVKDVAYFKLIK